MNRFALALALGALAGCGANSLDANLVEYLSRQLGGEDLGREGDAVFLPIPSGVLDEGTGLLVGQQDFTLAAGDRFFLPVHTWFGETYEDGSTDPVDFPPDTLYTVDNDVLVTLDGEPLIDSATDDLADFFVEVTYFDEPIVYDQPTDYGSINAIYVKGLAVTSPKLDAGTHEVRLTVSDPFLTDNFGFFGYDNTWNLTVE
jgi:hypothetical protein